MNTRMAAGDTERHGGASVVTDSSAVRQLSFRVLVSPEEVLAGLTSE